VRVIEMDLGLSRPVLMAVAAILCVIAIVNTVLIGYNAGAFAVTSNDAPSGVAMLGSPDAKVTIIEYSDFQCPFCARFYTGAYPQIKAQYVETGKANIVFKDYPLSFHPQAQKAAEAGKCALEQGNEKFWKLHDLIFQNQAQLSVDNLKLWAVQAGVNAAKFNDCLDSGRMAAAVQRDFAEGQAAGVRGTPTFIVNGKQVVGAQPFEAFQTAIDAALAGQ